MNNINTVILTGRLVRDVELKYTSNGVAMGTFTLAVNKNIKKNDKFVEETSFFNCVMFGKFIESICDRLKKGSQIAVEGSLRQDMWEVDGKVKSRVKINVETIEMLWSKYRDNGDTND